MKLKARLLSGEAIPTIDTVTLPDYDKKGREIPGTDHVVASIVRDVVMRITFISCVSAKEADDIINGMGSGSRDKIFTIEDTP